MHNKSYCGDEKLMDETVFIDIAPFGKLEYVRELFSNHAPIFFICKNNKKDLYLCVMFSSNGYAKNWLLTQVSTKTLLDLIRNKITIRESFLIDTYDKYSLALTNKGYTVKVNDAIDWNPETSYNLPTAGEYLDL